MSQFSALVVDDEPLARKRVVSLLKERGWAEVSEAAHGEAAVEFMLGKQPDLMFLDVQMPKLSGFEVLQQIPKEALPVVVFVTAYDKFALRAFDAHALDYLLKPFSDERFNEALDRAIEQLQLRTSNSTINSDVNELLQALNNHPSYQQHLVVPINDRARVINVESIDWIESAGNYVKVHVGRDSYLLRETMTAMERKLDPAIFLRIHRSSIVNINSVKEFQPWSHGDYIVILKDNQQLRLSRGYRELLRERLQVQI